MARNSASRSGALAFSAATCASTAGLACIARGIPILVEKPIAATPLKDRHIFDLLGFD